MTNNLNNPAIVTPSPSPGVLICDHFNQKKGYKVTRYEGTKDWLMTYTISGQGQFTVGDDVQTVEKGDLAILKPKTSHIYETLSSHWEFVWVHFLPRETWIDLLLLQEPFKGLQYYKIEQNHVNERILGCFRRMIRDNHGIHSLSKELSMNALEEILLLVNQILSHDIQTIADSRVQEVLQIFSQNLKEQHTIQSLSKQINLSPSRLSHLFREQVGNSVMSTLLAMRLKHAARLLEYTNLSITEIARDVGFSSPFYFTKQFTSFYGLNPTMFRKQVVSEQSKNT
ncbi:helix-turn-helix domain-containing protein [Lederbergia wuyishanensis]|uniref:AraC family transcriptional regulator of arabinose operon n=1 Tax=Lederbergia wuyishanensis TaxID=1347903 RepID=A0ABU0D4X0_9BACI|nr:helix-turn-helix domain-containing protein [Lederbergia wuyishanensis]MCJ8009547.1 helix-turn-helix domain-containing protein [Lederbergia wuyishanensis]MDQ0343452.1 AraC family transcriptional regulator of arabinose operon [Lederbergia wuyishanensis]